ncbi:hypothetical protein WJX74_005970 [Apatococcus lobatus]|uniref:Uncharacterized protein n=1 Tax=Apatococcus lobatus TaxID=904363 RepID=A0AAW1SGU8_9CHLO
MENLPADELALSNHETPNMFLSNLAVQGHNQQFMDQMEGSVQTAEDSLVQHTSDTGIARAMLEQAQNLNSKKTGALPYSTELKIEMPVELAASMGVAHGMTYGAKGTLKAKQDALRFVHEDSEAWQQRNLQTAPQKMAAAHLLR